MIQLVRCLLVAFVLFGCSKEQKTEDQRFLKTYTEILVQRFKNADTSIANRKIDTVLINNGFNQESFKQEFFRYMNQDPKILRTLIDSANVRAKQLLHNDTASTLH
jgi:hypothetical protein